MDSNEGNRVAEFWYNKGLSLESQGELDEAIKAYEKAVKVNPKYVDAWFKKGEIHEYFLEFEEAWDLYNRVVELDPDNSEAWFRLGIIMYCEIGSQPFSEKDQMKVFEVSNRLFDTALVLNPKETRSWYYKGKSLQKLEKLEEAVEAFNKILKIESDHFPALSGKNEALYYIGLQNDALETFDRLISRNPNDIVVLKSKVEHLYHQKEKSFPENCISAFEICNTILEINPKERHTKMMKNSIVNLLLCHNSSETILKKLLKNYPEDTHILRGLERVHEMKGEYEKAIEICNRILEISPGMTNFEKIKQRMLENIPYIHNTRDHAEEIFSRLLEKYPRDLVLLEEYASFLYCSQKYDEALYLYEQMVEMGLHGKEQRIQNMIKVIKASRLQFKDFAIASY